MKTEIIIVVEINCEKWCFNICCSFIDFSFIASIYLSEILYLDKKNHYRKCKNRHLSKTSRYIMSKYDPTQFICAIAKTGI